MRGCTGLVWFILIVIFVGCLTADSLGQDTATVTGTVTDPSGAVVADASIRLYQKATGAERVVSSNGSGVYTADLLLIGEYKVEVSKAGFKTFIQDGLILNTGDRKNLGLTLQLGQVGQTVNVTNAGSLVQSESSDVSAVFTGEKITELAVNGRNFLTLATLTTGVSNNLPDQPQVGVIGGMDGLNISGMHGSYLRVTIDGAEDQNSGSNVQLVSYPALESIAEFRILASNYSAEYGGSAGGGQITVVTKAGTQRFHGSLYEFIRNDAFDARNYFAPSVTPLKYNNFGWTLGGPVFIPGKYNQNKTKDFFFFSQEYRRIRTAASVRTRVPTDAQRNGDFSNTLNTFTGQSLVLIDPTTGQPFQNNQIPTSRISQNAQLLLGLWPTPNYVDPNNQFVNVFTHSSAPVNARQDTFRWDHNFSEKQRIMLRYTQDANVTTSVPVQWSADSLPNLKSVMSNPSKNTAIRYTALLSPTLLNEASFTWSRQRVNVTATGPIAKPSGYTVNELFPENPDNRAPDQYVSGWANYSVGPFPWGNNANQLEWTDNLTKNWGAHALTLGGLFLYNYRDESLMGTSQGAYSFTGQFTGDAMGDMLLGMPASYSETNTVPKGHWTTHSLEAFVQDNWKATRRLTLNLGLRYYYWGPFEERQHRMTDFSTAHFDLTKVATLDPVSGRILTQPDPLNGLLLAGQNGVPNNLYGGNYLNNVSPRVGFAWDLVGDGKTVLRGGFGEGYYHPEGTYNLTSNPPYENTVSVNTPNFNDPSQGTAAPIFPASLQTLQGYWSPRTAQWSLGVQRQIAENFVVKAAYVADTGWRLPIRQDINQPQRVSGFDFDPAINAGTIALNSFRPYQGYGSILRAVDAAYSDYRSLQASVEKRFSGGLQFNVGYTWSSTKGIGGGRNGANESYAVQDGYNLGGEYGPLAWDRHHVLVANYIWELPFLKNGKGFVRKAFGGWELSGIVLAQSGAPQTAGLSFPNLGLARRATVTGPIKYPKKFTEWFDPSALSEPAPGFFGKSSLYSIYGPGMINCNVSIFKNNKITETANLQLRFEFFNVFNHTNWTNVDTNLGSPTIGTVQGARDPRIIQLGARFSF
jgi:hypothetical protein